MKPAISFSKSANAAEAAVRSRSCPMRSNRWPSSHARWRQSTGPSLSAYGPQGERQGVARRRSRRGWPSAGGAIPPRPRRRSCPEFPIPLGDLEDFSQFIAAESGAADVGGLRRRPPAQRGPPRPLDRVDQLPGVDGFGDILVHSRLQARSRSPFRAWAVIATIGTWPPLCRSRTRIAAVASNPSISGICTSISTRSNFSAASGREGLAAVADGVDRVPFPFQQSHHQLLIHETVFGQQDAQRAQAADAVFGARSPWASSSAVVTPMASMMASSNSDCFTGFIRKVVIPNSGSGRRPPADPPR